MSHSEVDKATLLPSGDVEISIVLPDSKGGDQYVIEALVTQRSIGGKTSSAMAHTSYVFTQTVDDGSAVFPVPCPAGVRFDPDVGIEVKAWLSFSCWSTLDPATGDPATCSWQLSSWA